MDHPLSIEVSNEVTIPLTTRGTKVLFRTFKPSQAQLEVCPKIQMNSADPWNPMEVKMGELATSTSVPFCMSSLNLDHKVTRKYRDPDSDEALLHSIGTGCCHYGTALNRAIEETSRFGHDVRDPVLSISTDRHEKVTELALAERFGIGLERARATL